LRNVGSVAQVHLDRPADGIELLLFGSFMHCGTTMYQGR
jgi:hypothetical protein